MVELLENREVIIGRTKSGKPIYISHMQHGPVNDWTVSDLEDGLEAHLDAAEAASGKSLDHPAYDKELYTPSKERVSSHKASAAWFRRLRDKSVEMMDKLGLVSTKGRKPISSGLKR